MNLPETASLPARNVKRQTSGGVILYIQVDNMVSRSHSIIFYMMDLNSTRIVNIKNNIRTAVYRIAYRHLGVCRVRKRETTQSLMNLSYLLSDSSLKVHYSSLKSYSMVDIEDYIR